ncbi:MAG TPA: hypothetical protein PK400_11705, partial [Phycisphaerales bacterium]|nr:hypothetical protein [Phycisphaerales bacterium]
SQARLKASYLLKSVSLQKSLRARDEGAALSGRARIHHKAHSLRHRTRQSRRSRGVGSGGAGAGVVEAAAHLVKARAANQADLDFQSAFRPHKGTESAYYLNSWLTRIKAREALSRRFSR